MYKAICEAIHREMDALEEKYSHGTQMSAKDLEDIDRMAHALKNLATYEAMKGRSEYDGSYRERSRDTGRYASRDEGYSRDDGYRRY